MDYQIVPKSQNQHFMFVISLLIIFNLPGYNCIVNRDLVLTPKQGLQLSGKRIFYDEENSKNDQNTLDNNDTMMVTGTRPWERTLKHVTYLTLFTNAANGIITGNFSKVKEYNDFLASIYVRSLRPIDSRFGDIVTLAQGRLETMPNGSYRFVEGDCDYECARENKIVAMWHIQKIRHRDTADHKYHYEMKFSVSPMNAKAATETVVRGGPNKRTIMEERKTNVQTFIQKEDDYPHSFRKIVSDKDEDFLEKRYDSARNFRHVSPHYQMQQVTPIPQSTFLRGVYQHPPPNASPLQHHNSGQQHSLRAHAQIQHSQHHQQVSPLPERLNIGEFYKGNYAQKSTSKIELFPNLLNMFIGKPQHTQHTLPPPTTFRPPTYQMKFPRPEIYTLQQHQIQELPKYSEYQQLPLPQSQEQFNHRTPPSVPIVTHHYHHHFFMPNNSAITLEQALHNSEEESHDTAAKLYQNEVTEIATPQGYVTNFYEEQQTTTPFRQQHVTPQNQYHATNQQQNLQPNYYSNYHIQQILPPAPQKFVFPNTQIEPQRVVHLTSTTTPLKKPQYDNQQQQFQTQQHQQHQQHFENRPFISSLEYTTVHVPLLISYPAPLNEEKTSNVPTLRNKPFVQSDPIEDSIQYSEPDPLYANTNEGEITNENKFFLNGPQQVINQEPQLESPDHYNHEQSNQQENIEEADNRKEHSESVEAQLPAPNNDKHDEIETANAAENIKQDISSSTIKIPNDRTTMKNIKTEASNSIETSTKKTKIFASRNKRISLKTGTTTSSTTTTKKPTTSPSPSAKPISTTLKTSTTLKPKKMFVSTSSTESPLRTISRYRNTYARASSTSTTTTEKPVLKWTPKRKGKHSNFIATSSTTTVAESNEIVDTDNSEESNEYDENEDFKMNESNNLKIPSLSSFLPTTSGDFSSQNSTELSNDITPTVSSTTPLPTSASSSASPTSVTLLSHTLQSGQEIYEILTQKSVSKSVSLKVGQNGEEIPFIVDDVENEVKTV